MLAININRCAISLCHLFSISSVRCTTKQIYTNSVKIDRRCEFNKVLETLNFEKEINSFRFFVVIDELWNDLVHKLVDLVCG
jgi:hypothetical protein